MFFQVIKESPVRKAGMLDGLRHSAGYFTLRQCVPAVDIDIDLFRLVEQADQVRCQWGIHCRLSADGRVDCRKKAGRHIDKVNAAHIRRRGKPRQIARDAAAQRDERVVPAKSAFCRFGGAGDAGRSGNGAEGVE